jgi:hypothetical protein
MTDLTPLPEIVGGAGPHETAAIMAVLAHLGAEEAAARATPASRPRQSSWVLAWRPRQTMAPLPSHNYNAMPWAELDAIEDVNP